MRTRCERGRRWQAGSALVLATLALACADPTGPFPPGPPGQLAAVVAGPAAIRLTWSLVPGAEEYRLERAGGTFPSDFRKLDGERLTVPTFLDRDVHPGLTYRYRVAASARGKQGGYSDSVLVSLNTP